MALYLYLKRTNIGVVERIEVENYVKGVVNAEIGSTTTSDVLSGLLSESAQIEALKVQAIAARTYAVRYVNSRKDYSSGQYDLDDTTKYQVYDPKISNSLANALNKAVSETAGMVITYSNKLITAVYSASNGGRIRSAEEVWGYAHAYLVSKADPYTKRSGYKKNGHGVGMSQRGAIQAASEGLSAMDILKFYYPGTAIKSDYNGTSTSQVITIDSGNLTNKGALIVNEAKKHIGKPYVWGKAGPASFDCSGFVYYVYKTAINYDWVRTTAYYQYKKGRTISTGDMRAGDLIFFVNTYNTGNTPNISHVAIATGNGDEFIHASGDKVDIVPSLSGSVYWTNHYFTTRRLLSDTETMSGGDIPDEYISMSPTEVANILAGMKYSEESDIYLNRMLDAREVIKNLKPVSTENSLTEGATVGSSIASQRVGYLLDLTNGGEFKFVVPEYNLETQANWDVMSILGRSVEIRGYNSTSARSISISLELIAGEGLYISKGDRVAAMHKDIAFVQSLEYPDYSKAIVFPPARVYLYLNSVTQIRGIVSHVSVNYKKPFDTQNRPMMATLDFTVVQISDNPPDYADIRNSADNSY